MNHLKIKKENLISCVWILGTILVMYLLKFPCLFKWITGLDCPGCGITRAYISLLHLDLRQAFSYNRAFWVVPICLVFFLFDGPIFKNKWVNAIVTSSPYLLLILNWIFFKLL